MWHVYLGRLCQILLIFVTMLHYFHWFMFSVIKYIHLALVIRRLSSANLLIHIENKWTKWLFSSQKWAFNLKIQDSRFKMNPSTANIEGNLYFQLISAHLVCVTIRCNCCCCCCCCIVVARCWWSCCHVQLKWIETQQLLVELIAFHFQFLK